MQCHPSAAARAAAARLVIFGAVLLPLWAATHEVAADETPPPQHIVALAHSASSLADDGATAGRASRVFHDSRRFADGLTEGWSPQEARAASDLARRHARSRARAVRGAKHAASRLTRELDRWHGNRPGGFYSVACLAGITRAIANAERAGVAARDLVESLGDRAGSTAAIAAFGAANDDATAAASRAHAACDAVILDLMDNAVGLLGSMQGEVHRTVLERRFLAFGRVHDEAQTTDDSRRRAALLAREYRMLRAIYRRASDFAAREARAGLTSVE